MMISTCSEMSDTAYGATLRCQRTSLYWPTVRSSHGRRATSTTMTSKRYEPVKALPRPIAWATAEIAISASATVGSQTVTVTTGAEQATLANGFSVQAAIPYISLTTTSTTPLAPGLSGFNDA